VATVLRRDPDTESPLAAAQRPPLPRAALRVGVTGHRTLRPQAVDRLRDQAREVLGSAREAVRTLGPVPGLDTAVEPRLILVSPLAEGADQLVAEAGLDLGYELQCAFPFPAEVYARDFEPGSEAGVRFDALRARAAAVFEMDGSRERAEDAYLAVGRLVLEQSDLLVAIWDGKDEKGRGGTGQIVRDALEAGIPVAVLSPDEGTAPLLRVCPGDERECTAQAREVGDQVRGLLAAPGSEAALAEYAAFLDELPPGRRWIVRLGLLPAPEPDATPDLPLDAPDAPNSPSRLRAFFRGHYEWCDALAVHYARLYRRGFGWNYVFGALAVTFALLAHVAEDVGHDLEGWTGAVLSFGAKGLVVAEVLALLVILAVYWRGHGGRWLEKATGYRTLAEHLRQMRHLLPLGLGVPFSRPPAHLGPHADLRLTWMNHHFRAVLREAGIPTARCTPAYVESARAMLATEWIEPQRAFHARRSEDFRHRLHRLERRARWCFGAALAAALLHLTPLGHALGVLLLAIAAGAPAWGAALHGILSQSEFKRLAQRYASMHESLEILSGRLAPRDRPPSLRDLRDVARDAAVEMIEEVNDWQVLYRAHVIPTP